MSTAMPPLWLDYQRPPRGPQLPGILLLVAGLILLALLLKVSQDLSTETASVEQQVFKLRQTAERQRLFASVDQAAAGGAGAEAPLPSSYSAKRWESLFTALETASDETVTLLGLAPGTREIVITGEAKGLPAALDYVQRLQASGILTKAHLAKYEVVREHPQQPVRFTVLAEWQEAAR